MCTSVSKMRSIMWIIWKNCIHKTNLKTFLIFLFLTPFFLLAHEGHLKEYNPQNIENHHGAPLNQMDGHQENHKHNHGLHNSKSDSNYKKFIKWIGNFHPIAIHFPIALIVMTGFSELLLMLFPKSNFGYASRFMIISAAITSIPAVLLGLAYGYEAAYSSPFSEIFWWHRFCGITTSILAISTALINELNIRKITNKNSLYALLLILSVIFVTTTGYLGGEMTFGLHNLFP